MHMFSDSKSKEHYLIHDVVKNTAINHKISTQQIFGSAMLLYQNRINKLAVYDKESNNHLDAVYLSGSIIGFNFYIKQEWKLPMPSFLPGHMLSKHYIIILGGETSGDKFVDAIHLLDL